MMASGTSIIILHHLRLSVIEQLNDKMWEKLAAQSQIPISTIGELIARCKSSLQRVPAHDENHTVAAAALSRSGETFVGLNVYHFTGGPCAELVVMGIAAAAGVLAPDITAMVAVVRRPGEGPDDNLTFEVLSPCGRCRQVLLDYNPNIIVVLPDKGEELMLANVKSLMLCAYVWPDGNTAQEAK